MENPTYFNGLTHYDLRRDPEFHDVHVALPEEIGTVHAVRDYMLETKLRRGHRQPEFLNWLTYKTAMCGATVKVILPTEFDPGDEEVCQRCVGPVVSGERVPRKRGRHEIAWDYLYDQDSLDDVRYGIDGSGDGDRDASSETA